MEEKFIASNDKFGDYLVHIEDGDCTVITEVDLETLISLGVTEEELEEINRGYEISCSTQAVELLWSLAGKEV